MAKNPQVIEDPGAMRAWSERGRAQGRRIGLVPTMGALHEGHLSLMDFARPACDDLVVSIFVNPLQFNDQSDLAAYPRTWEADLAMCADHGVDLVFAPRPDTMYPEGYQTRVSVPKVASGMEGDHRPGHFDGVATVVLKLFNLVQPHLAAFGEKDFQQLKLVQRMVRDLDLPVEVVGRPTVREEGGLAMSSRNRHLSPSQRDAALVLHRALAKGRELAQAGEKDPVAIADSARGLIEAQPGINLEYLEIADADTLEPAKDLDRPARMLLAAQVGSTRLIDNLALN